MVVTPVGGLPEAVEHGVNGVVADAVDAVSVADAVLAAAEQLDELAGGRGLVESLGRRRIGSACCPPDIPVIGRQRHALLTPTNNLLRIWNRSAPVKLSHIPPTLLPSPTRHPEVPP